MNSEFAVQQVARVHFANAGCGNGCDVERDVVRGRQFDAGQKWLPDAMAMVNGPGFLNATQRRRLSQVEARTFAELFRVVERLIADPLGNEPLAADDDVMPRIIAGQQQQAAMFDRVAGLAAEMSPPGYRFVAVQGDIAQFFQGRSVWSILALAAHLAHCARAHYAASIAPDAGLSPLTRDVLFFHWKALSRHAADCERAWSMAHVALDAMSRDDAVNDFIELYEGIDALLLFQAPADTAYFVMTCDDRFTPAQAEQLQEGLLDAYRWQFVRSGAHAHFADLFGAKLRHRQAARVESELASFIRGGESRAATGSRQLALA